MSDRKRSPYWDSYEVRWGWIDGSRYHIGYTPERIRVETRGEAVEYVPEHACHNAAEIEKELKELWPALCELTHSDVPTLQGLHTILSVHALAVRELGVIE